MKKGAKKDKTWNEKAYHSTQVDYSQTQSKVYELLEELNIQRVRFTREGNDFILEFLAKIDNKSQARHIKMTIPFTPDLGMTEKQKKKKINALHRVLFYQLKAKFIAVVNGLKEFDEEFLPDIMVKNSEGKEVKMSELILPKFKEAIKNEEKVKLSISNEQK